MKKNNGLVGQLLKNIYSWQEQAAMPVLRIPKVIHYPYKFQ